MNKAILIEPYATKLKLLRRGQDRNYQVRMNQLVLRVIMKTI